MLYLLLVAAIAVTIAALWYFRSRPVSEGGPVSGDRNDPSDDTREVQQ